MPRVAPTVETLAQLAFNGAVFAGIKIVPRLIDGGDFDRMAAARDDGENDMPVQLVLIDVDVTRQAGNV